MLVLKFGGTSVGSHEGIEKAISILSDEKHKGKTGVVVVSAFSGITDTLIEMSHQAASGKDGFTDLALSIKKRHKESAAAFLTGDDL